MILHDFAGFRISKRDTLNSRQSVLYTHTQIIEYVDITYIFFIYISFYGRDKDKNNFECDFS